MFSDAYQIHDLIMEIYYLNSTLPFVFSWTQYVSWMLYANEAMTVAQWKGVENISKMNCFTVYKLH